MPSIETYRVCGCVCEYLRGLYWVGGIQNNMYTNEILNNMLALQNKINK